MGDDDPIARLRAEMDQAKEGMREIPRLLWAFYSEAVAAGFSEAQALRLTIGYMSTTFSPRRGDEDE